MTRWHFCNSTKLLCLGSQNTRNQKRCYGSVYKKSVRKSSICLGCGESRPKTHIFGLGWLTTGAKMRALFSFSSSPPQSPFLSTTPFLSSLSLQLTHKCVPFFFFLFPATISISLNNSISLFSLPATYPSTVAGSLVRCRRWFVATAGSLHLHFLHPHFLFPWLNFICSF